MNDLYNSFSGYYLSVMEIEGIDVHVDEVQDGVIIYANGITHDDSCYGKACSQDVEQLPEISDIGQLLVHVSDENGEVEECVVKECNSDKSDDQEMKSRQEEKCEESVTGCKSRIEKDGVIPERQNIKNHHKKMQACGKKAIRPTAGNSKTRCTVPQPFALATEKRALHGTRPYGAECDNTTSEVKLSHIRVPLRPSSVRQNQVNFFDQLYFVLILRIYQWGCDLVLANSFSYQLINGRFLLDNLLPNN